MKKCIAFTGTRKGLTAAQQEKLGEVIRLIAPDQIEAHHGLCEGADDSFHKLVEELYKPDDRKIVGHPPIDQKYYSHNACDEMWAAKGYLVRNHDIVDQAEILIACPKGKEIRRSGTWATIRYANNQRKPVTIVWPDGSVTEIDPKSNMREAEMTESEKGSYLSKISKLFSNGVTEVYMREIMNAIKDKPEDIDIRFSNEFFEAAGFQVDARTKFNRHPDYEIVRTYVRKAEAKGDEVEE